MTVLHLAPAGMPRIELPVRGRDLRGRWRTAIGVAWLLATGVSCASGSRPQAGRLRLALSPASFGTTVSLQQHVHVEYAGRDADLDALLDISPDSLTLVGLTLGRRVMTLRFDGTRLTEERHPLVPGEVQGADILTDMQLALWPVDAVRGGLPSPWSVEELAGTRLFSVGGRRAIEITYEGTPRWSGTVTLRDLLSGYRLVVQSALLDP